MARNSMPGGWTFKSAWSIAFYSVFAIVTLLRMFYALHFMDPFSGPDADNYFRVYSAFKEGGFLSDVEGVPFWQPGYPWFLLIVDSLIPGSDIRSVMLVQSIVASLTILIFRGLCLKFLNSFKSNLIATLFSLNLAFFAASTQLMYETILTFFSVSSIFLLWSALHTYHSGRKYYLYLVFFYVSFGMSVFIQPKVILVFYLILISLMGLRSYRTWFHLSIATLFSLCFLLFRNLRTGTGFGISANFRTHILLGTEKVNIFYESRCNLTERFDSLGSVTCLILERFSNLPVALKSTIRNFFNFFAPYIGPLGDGKTGTGSWFHGINFRRLLPDEVMHLDIVRFLDFALSAFWVVLFISVVLAGGLFSFTRNSIELHFARSMFLGFVGTLLPVLIGIGDSRYRIPSIPFYITVAICFSGSGRQRFRSINQ